MNLVMTNREITNRALSAAGGEFKSSFRHNRPQPEAAATPDTGFPGLAGKRIVICEDEGITQMQLVLEAYQAFQERHPENA